MRGSHSADSRLAPMLSRIAITDVAPVVEHGRYPAKATVDEEFPVRATVFREGPGHVGAGVVPIGPDGEERRMASMVALGNDAYEAWVAFDEPGAWSFRIEEIGRASCRGRVEMEEHDGGDRDKRDKCDAGGSNHSGEYT